MAELVGWGPFGDTALLNPSALDITFSLCYKPVSDATPLTVQNERPENVRGWDLRWHPDFHVRCSSSRGKATSELFSIA